MDLAKPRIDFGLSTNNLEPMLAFWQDEVGLPFDHLLPIRRGHDQHRHDALGSVIKINHTAEPLAEGPPTGYRELYIARDGPRRAEADGRPGRQPRDAGPARLARHRPDRRAAGGAQTWRRIGGSTPRRWAWPKSPGRAARRSAAARAC